MALLKCVLMCTCVRLVSDWVFDAPGIKWVFDAPGILHVFQKMVNFNNPTAPPAVRCAPAFYVVLDSPQSLRVLMALEDRCKVALRNQQNSLRADCVGSVPELPLPPLWDEAGMTWLSPNFDPSSRFPKVSRPSLDVPMLVAKPFTHIGLRDHILSEEFPPVSVPYEIPDPLSDAAIAISAVLNKLKAHNTAPSLLRGTGDACTTSLLLSMTLDCLAETDDLTSFVTALLVYIQERAGTRPDPHLLNVIQQFTDTILKDHQYFYEVGENMGTSEQEY